jgi:hypothetical protein
MMWRWWCGARVTVLLMIGFPLPAAASSLLPLVTEEAQTLPSGTAEAILGATYLNDSRFPGFTPPAALRSQTVVQGPQLRLQMGAGSWAEIQASYETIYLDERAANGQTNWQFGSGDMRIGSKFWLKRETEHLPALGLRLFTKLPNANRSARLGTDDTDFTGDALVSKNFGPFAAHVNLGITLLGNSGPTIGHSFKAGGQDDLFDYNVALVSAPLGKPIAGATALRIMGELTGFTGSHYDNERSALRVGIQLQRGPTTVYLGTSVGLITGSEDFGVNGGVVYRFEAAQSLKDE